MNTNFMDKASKIIADIRTSTRIDDVDAEVIEKILQGALNEYYDALNEYYEDKYYSTINSARNSAYDSGYDDGYSFGYDDGFSEGYSEGHAEVKTLLKMR